MDLLVRRVAERMREVYLRGYIVGILASGIALAASWIYWYGVALEPRIVIAVLVLAGLVLMGEVLPIHVSDRTTFGTWDIGLVVAIAAVGPSWAAVVALPTAVYVGRRDLLRLTFEVGHSLTIVYLAGIVFSFTSTPLLLGTTASLAQILYGTFATSLMLLAANAVIMSILLKIKYDRSIVETYKEDFEPYIFFGHCQYGYGGTGSPGSGGVRTTGGGGGGCGLDRKPSAGVPLARADEADRRLAG